MDFANWIRRPFIRLQLRSGNETIVQSVGLLKGFRFDKDLNQPALFFVDETVTGNVEVVYWNGTTEIVTAQFLSGRNILIRQIKSANTTVALADIRLEV